jgi:hypothetical protein
MLKAVHGDADALGPSPPRGRGRSPVCRSHQGVDGVLRLAGGRSRGLTSNRSRLGLLGGAAPSRTFPVLSSAVCVIRAMELWYACTVDGTSGSPKLYVFARIVRQPEGVDRTIRAARRAIGGLRHPPAAQGPSLWPSLLSVPSRAAPWRRIVTLPGHWRSFGGWVWSPSTLCGRPSAWRPADPEQPGPPYDPGHP